MELIRFKTIGHACVLVTSGNFSLITDPWFQGHIQANALQAFPPISPLSPDEIESIRAVHISHIHQDHFCRSTLKRFNPDTQIIISNYEDKAFYNQIKDLGFRNITEVFPFQEEQTLGPFKIRTFTPEHFNGSFDSAFILSLQGKNYYFMNDCRLSEEQYKKIIQLYPEINGAFLSYSHCTPFPTCYDFKLPPPYHHISTETEVLKLRKLGWDQFSTVLNNLNPRWAVPYADSLRFLKKSLLQHNRMFKSFDESKSEFGLNSNSNFILATHGDELIEEGNCTSLHQNNNLTKNISEFLIEDSSYNKEESTKDFQQMLFQFVGRNSRNWDKPMKVRFKVKGNKKDFFYDFSYDGEHVKMASVDPDLEIEYSEEFLTQIQKEQMTFIKMHYMYQFKCTIYRRISKQQYVHKWT